MIHVRRYVPDDLGRVLPMAEAFHDESPVYRTKPFSAAKVADLLDMARQSPDWLAIIAEDDDGELTGFILATVQGYFFCDETNLLDLSIFVTPTMRGHASFIKLMAYMESWAKSMGAIEANLGITTGINQEQALRSFVKLGYLPSGIQVSKAL